jgi:hypothetical protein
LASSYKAAYVTADDTAQAGLTAKLAAVGGHLKVIEEGAREVEAARALAIHLRSTVAIKDAALTAAEGEKRTLQSEVSAAAHLAETARIREASSWEAQEQRTAALTATNVELGRQLALAREQALRAAGSKPPDSGGILPQASGPPVGDQIPLPEAAPTAELEAWMKNIQESVQTVLNTHCVALSSTAVAAIKVAAKQTRSSAESLEMTRELPQTFHFAIIRHLHETDPGPKPSWMMGFVITCASLKLAGESESVTTKDIIAKIRTYLNDDPPGTVAIAGLIRAAASRPEVLESPMKPGGGGLAPGTHKELDLPRSTHEATAPAGAARSLDALLGKMAEVITKLADNRDKESTTDDGAKIWKKFDDVAQCDLNLKDPLWRKGGSVAGAMVMKALLDPEEDAKSTNDTLTKIGLQTWTTDAIDRHNVARAYVVSAKNAGNLLLRFSAFVATILNTRMVNSTADSAKSAKIATQLVDFNQSMIEYRQALLSVSIHGWKLQQTAEADVDTEMMHFVKIAMGLQANPTTVKQHAQMGFPVASGAAALCGTSSTTAGHDTLDAASFPLMGTGAGAKALVKRVVGQVFPTSHAVLGTSMGSKCPITDVCYGCNGKGHRAYECPQAFYAKYATTMPGHDKHGAIVSPGTYWRANKAGEEISAEIANEWLAHAWSQTFDSLGVISLGISKGTFEECGSRP